MLNLTKKLASPKESKLFLSLLPTLREKRTKEFTTLAFTFITIAFFGLFAISPTLGTISDLQKQLDDSTFVDQQLQRKISNLTSLQTQYAQIQPQLNPVYAGVPTNPSIDTFVGQVHTLALSNSIQLNRVQTLPVDISTQTPTVKYLSYVFSVEAQGNLPSLQKYVTSLGIFDRLVTFESIVYTRVGNVDNTFRVTIRGSVYFKSDSQ